jgi:hypothetical protein
MNKYEKHVVGKKGGVPVFKPGRSYCYRCAMTLWPSIYPEDTDLSYFMAGGAYILLPEEQNALCRWGELPQCGHGA